MKNLFHMEGLQKNIDLVTHPFDFYPFIHAKKKEFQNMKYIEHWKQVSVLHIPFDIQVCAHIAYTYS